MAAEGSERIKALRIRRKPEGSRSADESEFLREYEDQGRRRADARWRASQPAAAPAAAPAAVECTIHETRPIENGGDPLRWSWIPIAPAAPSGEGIEAADEAAIVDQVAAPADPQRLERGAQRFAGVVAWLFDRGVDAGLEMAGPALAAAASGGDAGATLQVAAQIVGARGEASAYVHACAKRVALKYDITALASLPYEDELVTVGAGVGGGLLALVNARRKLELRAGRPNAGQASSRDVRAPDVRTPDVRAPDKATAPPVDEVSAFIFGGGAK